MPDEPAAAIAHVSSLVTYGWGCIPVHVRIGRTDFTTSLFPKDEGYLVPVKAAARTAEHVELNDHVTVRLELDV